LADLADLAKLYTASLIAANLIAATLAVVDLTTRLTTIHLAEGIQAYLIHGSRSTPTHFIDTIIRCHKSRWCIKITSK